MNSESRIQQEIVKWFRNNYCLKHHQPRYLIFSVPNEGENIKEQLKKKATGLMAGVSDLIVVLDGELLFVECKDDTGRQSEKQITFEKSVQLLGFKYILVRSLEDFQKKIKKYLV